jgi:hypothetical protein
MNPIKIVFFLSCLWISQVNAWDANGHALITQACYQYLTPKAREWLHRETHTHHSFELNAVSIWLDTHRYGKFKKYSSWHYINLPYGEEFYFKKPYAENVITAIQEARTILQDKHSSRLQKQFAIRVLLHTVEDIHQPLHTISYYSKSYKKGDRGGTLWKIKNNFYRGTLHQFWDIGGGWLKGFSWHDQSAITFKLRELSKENCDWQHIKIEPKVWALSSYELAKEEAYFPPHSKRKFLIYQEKVKQITKKQIKVAACHLAATLNQISA